MKPVSGKETTETERRTVTTDNIGSREESFEQERDGNATEDDESESPKVVKAVREQVRARRKTAAVSEQFAKSCVRKKKL